MINKLKKHQEQIPYDMLSREVVQSIDNPNALAIWAYLQSKSDNWDVVEAHIREHFDIGRMAYMRAMKCLRDAGLYSFVRHKDKDNNFTGGHYHIYPFPQVSKSTPMETDTGIKEKEKLKEKESIKKKETRGSKKFIKPTVKEITEYSREKSLRFDPESFIDYYDSNGWLVGKNKMKDWKASVRSWAKKDWNNNNQANNKITVNNW